MPSTTAMGMLFFAPLGKGNKRQQPTSSMASACAAWFASQMST